MKIKQAYIDMDGVLADFMGAALALHDSSLEGYPKGLYKIEEHLGVTTDEFWRVIDSTGEDFWSSLELCEGALDLWEIVQPLNPIILTSPSMNPVCVSGKLKWLQEVFGNQFRDYIFCPAQHKKHLARDSCLLVDDRPQNVSDFIDSGGCGYLWPHIGNGSIVKMEQALNDLYALSEAHT